MAYGTRLAFEAIREAAAATIGATYGAVGSALSHHVRIVRIVSTLDKDVYLSIDGTTDMLRIAAGSFVLYDLATNRIQDDGLFLSIGTIFYARQTSAGAPATGTLWIETAYGQGGV